MNPSVKFVEPNKDFTLNFTFVYYKRKMFDVKPYLEYRVFKDLSLFYPVKPFLKIVQWQNEQDFCPDTLYLERTK
jgi:hypothetical protein